MKEENIINIIVLKRVKLIAEYRKSGKYSDIIISIIFHRTHLKLLISLASDSIYNIYFYLLIPKIMCIIFVSICI